MADLPFDKDGFITDPALVASLRAQAGLPPADAAPSIDPSVIDKDGVISDPAIVAKLRAAAKMYDPKEVQRQADLKTTGGDLDPLTTAGASFVNSLGGIGEGIQGALDYLHSESPVNHKYIGSWKEGRENAHAIDEARSRQNPIASGLGTAAGYGAQLAAALATGGGSAAARGAVGAADAVPALADAGLAARGAVGAADAVPAVADAAAAAAPRSMAEYLATESAKQAAIGGAQTGGESFNAGNDPTTALKDAIPGAVLGGLMPGAIAGAKPILNGVNDVITGIGGKFTKSPSPLTRLPTSDELAADVVDTLRFHRDAAKATMGKVYDAAGAAQGTFENGAFSALKSSLRKPLDAEFINTRIAPNAHATVDDVHAMLNSPAHSLDPVTGVPVSNGVGLKDVEEARRMIARQISAETNPTERDALIKVKQALDDHVQTSMEGGLFNGPETGYHDFLHARQLARDYYGAYGYKANDGGGSAFLRNVLDRNKTPEEAARLLSGIGTVGSDATAFRNVQQIQKTMQGWHPDEQAEVMKNIKQMLWQRVLGGEQSEAQLAKNVDNFLNKSGKSLANHIFTPEEQKIMAGVVMQPGRMKQAAMAAANYLASNAGSLGLNAGLGSAFGLHGAMAGMAANAAATYAKNRFNAKIAHATNQLFPGATPSVPSVGIAPARLTTNPNASLPIGVGWLAGQVATDAPQLMQPQPPRGLLK